MFRLMILGVIGATALATVAQAEKCEVKGQPPGLGNYSLTPVLSGLTKPIAIAASDALPYYFLAEQAGRIYKVSGTNKTLVLDIRSKVTDIGRGNDERGFLGMALHPRFGRGKDLIYVNYTIRGSDHTRIASYSLSGTTFSSSSEKVILEVEQPRRNHNGGALAFGPDGYLYIGLGDGGGAGDQWNNSQNLSTHLGKILRLDVDSASPYRVPADNPQWRAPGAKPEIYALGLRNPWRFSFDQMTGELWAGDVGQGKWEEINVIKKGANYGWRRMEGNDCYNPRSNCRASTDTAPVHAYPRTEGISVTGGYVYRGAKMPELTGYYLFGDFGTGTIWGLHKEGGQYKRRTLIESNVNIASFGLYKGEVFVLGFDGKVYQITRSQPAPGAFPDKLSKTGCFGEALPLHPIDELVPYEVSSPLWSDSAEKTRFIYLPGGSQVAVGPTGRLSFPDGTVLIKNFYLPVVGSPTPQWVESRLQVKRQGRFEGYTYRIDGEDGTYIGGGAVSRYTIGTPRGSRSLAYQFPSSSDCRQCHNASVGEAPGFRLEQLDLELADGHSQLDWLTQEGVFRRRPPSPDAPLVDYADFDLPLNARARSYLASNCAHCHNPQHTGGQVALDLRYKTPLEEMQACDVAPQHGGGANTVLLAAGEPQRSLMFSRIQSERQGWRMPRLSTSMADPLGTHLVRNWITNLPSCL